jgi:hypothetical protein
MRPGFQRLQMIRCPCKLLHLAGQRVHGASDCAYVSMRQASENLLSPIDNPRYTCRSAEMSAGRKSTDEVPDQDFSPNVSVSSYSL